MTTFEMINGDARDQAAEELERSGYPTRSPTPGCGVFPLVVEHDGRDLKALQIVLHHDTTAKLIESS